MEKLEATLTPEELNSLSSTDKIIELLWNEDKCGDNVTKALLAKPLRELTHACLGFSALSKSPNRHLFLAALNTKLQSETRTTRDAALTDLMALISLSDKNSMSTKTLVPSLFLLDVFSEVTGFAERAKRFLQDLEPDVRQDLEYGIKRQLHQVTLALFRDYHFIANSRMETNFRRQEDNIEFMCQTLSFDFYEVVNEALEDHTHATRGRLNFLKARGWDARFLARQNIFPERVVIDCDVNSLRPFVDAAMKSPDFNEERLLHVALWNFGVDTIEKNRAVAQFFMDRAKRPFDPEKIAQTFPHSPNDWLYICAALIKGDFLNNKEQDALFVMHEEELARRREKEKYVVFAANPKDDGVMSDFLRWVEARRSKQGLREGLSDLLVKTAKPRKI